MAEYIEREALVKKINDRIEALVKEYGYYDHYTTGFTDCADMVEDEQAADVVEVVRCRECKHFNMQKMECENDAVSTDHEGGASYRLNFYLDDFCSYGERKEGAE